MKHARMYLEAASVGLICERIIEGVPQCETNPTLMSLLVAAHGKVAGDPEIAALRNHLGASSPEWLAYVACRKEAAEGDQDRVLESILKRALVAAFKNAVTQGDYKILRVPTTTFNELAAAFQAAQHQFPGVE